MADSANETTRYPFTAFNFAVEIDVPGVSSQVCSASFQECDGLEMTMDVKTIREGGNNGQQLRLSGPLNFGTLTLKRGMTATFDLWDWFSAVLNKPSLRADAEVVVFAADGSTERARFLLKRCVPIKLKAPALNAKDGTVAIEELQLAYESLTLKSSKSSSNGFGFSASLSVSAGVSIGG
ncbi:MAG: phage tail protein [Anaerolinea sp.]|nr:phage tail protein [Anaerolinea sp.]